uniref:Dicer-2 n=1 Tax=Panagrolaimus sp. ES5 TaxID=591445 RepID=A0AC34GRH2_9BILA
MNANNEVKTPPLSFFIPLFVSEMDEEITLRDYQQKLVEHCIDNDAITVLPTGSGKTLIAISLMNTLISNKKKKCAFIVNKVVNVEQQYEYMKNKIKFKTEKWQRKLNQTDFIKFIQENDVIILTANAFMNGITHGWIKMENFALIVIDECHHCMAKNHPCRFIVNKLKEYKNKQHRPRFLGLTASGLNGKVAPHQLPQKFMELEITLGAKVVTSDEYLQDEHRHVVKESVFFIESYKAKTFDGLDTLEKFCLLNNELSSNIEFDPRKRIIECVHRAKTVIDDCGVYCGYIVIKHDIIPQIGEMSNDGMISAEKFDIFSCASTVFDNIQREMEKSLQNCVTYEQIKPHLHPRVTKIIEFLEAYDTLQIQKGKRCAAIIFAEKCDTVMALSCLFKKLGELRPSFIKSAYAVGAGTQKLKFDNDENSNNESLPEALQKFRNGEINCLVATQILEEGIDMSSCNLVLCTHIAPTFCSYIQSRGRARDSSSMFAYIISHEDRSKYIYNIHVFKTNEKFLLHRIANFKNSILDHKQVHYDVHHDSLEEPYTVESTGASVKLSTALGLVHHYCSQLPSDIYTPLSPKYRISQVSWGYICKMQLPSNSPVQDTITGHGYISYKLAVMSAALKTCKILHQRNELDDNLVPYSKEKFAEKENFTFEADSGTTKKHRLYHKKVANVLVDNFISANQPFSIYIIEMKLVDTVFDERNIKKRKVMDFKEDIPQVFGLCTNKPLPDIPTFPLFQKYGKHIASIKLAPKQFSISQKELTKLETFHTYIFEEILGISNKIAFQPTCAISSTLVVPLKKTQTCCNYEIDYEVAEKTVSGFPSDPTESERKTFVFDPEMYKDAIVKAWYRDVESHVYFVESVTSKDLNSEFDGTGFSSFKEYYTKHYKLDAYNHQQNLLDASKIIKELNCLLPPIIKMQKKNEKEYLVPEFVVIHPMPASYWLMLIKIPSVLYRINHLLLADEFRKRINNGNRFVRQPSNLDGLDEFYFKDDATIKKVEQLRLLEGDHDDEMDDDNTCDFSDEGFMSDPGCLESQWNDSLMLEDDLYDFEDGICRSSVKVAECENQLKNTQMNSTNAELLVPNDFYDNRKIDERISAKKLPKYFKICSFQTQNSLCDIQPALLLQALTTTGACDGFNLERLETMGDSFLKLVTTIYLYHRYQHQDEGKLTFLRSMQICNANLLKLGYQKDIPALMDEFNDNSFEVVSEDCTTLPNTIDVNEEYNHHLKQRMSDKSVADCVEALIGAHLTTLGPDSTIKFMEWLGLKCDIISSLKAPIESLTERFGFHEAQRHVSSKYAQKNFEELEKTIKYSFRDKSLLVQAFIHLSSHSSLGCYQRLEFLGDAVLDFLITQHLYNHNLKFSPGILTDLRSALVNNINFASLVVKHKIHDYLIVENAKLSSSIKKFAYLCDLKGDLNFHDMMQLVVENDAGEVLIEEVEVPKALGDIFESLAGAVFLDSEMSLEVVWQVFYNLMEDVIAKWCQDPPKSPIRELTESYKNRIGSFEKRPKVDGKACIFIKVDGKTTVSGVGKSERLAKRSAALEALKYFHQLETVAEFS